MDNEVLFELSKDVSPAELPQVGCRKVTIENIVPTYNNIGDKVVLIQYAYKSNDGVFHWALTYKDTDAKLKAIFPNGKIETSDIGSTKYVEIQYCDSKNGLYPSVVALDNVG